MRVPCVFLLLTFKRACGYAPRPSINPPNVSRNSLPPTVADGLPSNDSARAALGKRP